MITVTNASHYSINKASEMAYEIEYSDGTKVRAVESVGNTIRREYKDGTEWKMAGKSYVVDHSKNRQAEKIKATVLAFNA